MPAPVFLNSKSKRRLKSRRSKIMPEKCGQSRRIYFHNGPLKGLSALSSCVSLIHCQKFRFQYVLMPDNALFVFAVTRRRHHRAEEPLQAPRWGEETESNILFYALRRDPEKGCRMSGASVSRFR